MPKQRKRARKAYKAEWLRTAEDMTIKERITKTENNLLEELHRKKRERYNLLIQQEFAKMAEPHMNKILEGLEEVKTTMLAKYPYLKDFNIYFDGVPAERDDSIMLNRFIDDAKFKVRYTLAEQYFGGCTGGYDCTEDIEKIEQSIAEFHENPRAYIEKYPKQCQMYAMICEPVVNITENV